MDWNQRVKDCKRRAAIVYPHFAEARKEFTRLDRLWTYWENRAWEAQREVMKATIVPPNQTKQSIERHKERIAKAFKSLSKEDKKKLLEELRNG